MPVTGVLIENSWKDGMSITTQFADGSCEKHQMPVLGKVTDAYITGDELRIAAEMNAEGVKFIKQIREGQRLQTTNSERSGGL